MGGIISPCPCKRWTHLANNPGPCCYCKNARLVAFVLELLGFQGIKTFANRGKNQSQTAGLLLRVSRGLMGRGRAVSTDVVMMQGLAMALVVF